MTRRKFAAFDIDGTVFRWQLYHELFDTFMSRGLITASETRRIVERREAWQSRNGSYHDYEMTLVRAMNRAVVGVESNLLNSMADEILQAKAHRTYRYTSSLMKSLKAEGYVIIAISGSHQQLVDRFGAIHGIDIMVGRQYEEREGKLTAKSEDISGRKDEILRNLIEAHDLELAGSYAIGDSSGDISMLSFVEHPIAFNPDEQLRRTAMRNGWDIVIERKSLSYTLKKGTDGSYLLAETATE